GVRSPLGVPSPPIVMVRPLGVVPPRRPRGVVPEVRHVLPSVRPLGVLPSVSGPLIDKTAVFTASNANDDTPPSHLACSIFLCGGPQNFSGPGVPVAGSLLSIPPVVSAVSSALSVAVGPHVPVPASVAL